MSAKATRDEKPLLLRCLAIVFKERRHKKQAEAEKGEKPCSTQAVTVVQGQAVPSLSQSPKSGREIFEAFVCENKACYWNPHLEESVRNLKYMGCFHPSTILVGGRDIYMDTVKAAWARKVLRAPVNFTILKAGEVSGVSMEPLSQTQFTPLPEALCLIISELTRNNNNNGTASLDRVLDRLRDTYYGMQQPSEQIVYETLGSLIKERKLYHTGSGYGIMSPEMYQLNGCVTLQDHHLVIGGDPSSGQMPAIYIPLMPGGGGSGQTKAEMRSISCQTEQKQDGKNSPKDGSIKKSPGSTKEEKLSKRTAEKQEKAEKKQDRKQQQERSDKSDKKSEKGEKSETDGTSPPGRLERSHSMREKKSRERKEEAFARSSSLRYSEEKAKGLVKDINLKTCDVHQDKDKGEKSSLLSKLFGRNKKKSATEEDLKPDIEYATFSAQFPPPEWEWYEHQVQTVWVQTQQQQQQKQQKHVSKSHTWHHLQPPPQLTEAGVQAEESQQKDGRCVLHKSQTLPGQLTGQRRPRPRSTSSHSQESRSSYERLPSPPKPGQSKHGKSKKHKSPVDKYQYADNNVHLHQHSAPHPQPSVPNNTSANNLDPRHCVDARPKIPLANHNLFYGSGHAMQQTQVDEIPTDYPDSSIYHGGDQSFDTQQNHSAIYQTIPETATSNERKTRVFRKYREMHCASFPTSDISVEYNVRLPRKHNRMSQSRDSGVNCVGLMEKHCAVSASDHQLCADPGTAAENNRPPAAGSQYVSIHEAQIHSIPEHVHEDSGFNSPRTAELPVRGQGEHHTPTTDYSSHSQSKLNNNNASSSSSREPSQSPELDGSELYPPNGCLYSSNLHHQPLYGSSSWSSSVQTVREMPVHQPKPQPVLPPSDYRQDRSQSSPPKLDQNRDQSQSQSQGLRQVVVRQEPYTEIQLVPEPRKHSHSSKHKERSRDRSPKRLSGSYRDCPPPQGAYKDPSPTRAKHGLGSARRNTKDYSSKHQDWDNYQPHSHSQQPPQYYRRPTDYEVVGVV